MTKHKLPIVLSAAALVVAVLGSTPVGHAAENAVKTALFAKNAGKVNGITASRTPKPGRLLALDRNAKLPRSVLPAGLAGEQGPRGPQGPQGPAGSLSGAAAGGDFTGTFPNPQLAKNAVASDEVANRSLLLDDIAVLHGKATVNLSPIAIGNCISHEIPLTGAHFNDIVLVKPSANVSNGLVVFPVSPASDGEIRLRVCNTTGSVLDAPQGSWSYALFRGT